MDQYCFKFLNLIFRQNNTNTILSAYNFSIKIFHKYRINLKNLINFNTLIVLNVTTNILNLSNFAFYKTFNAFNLLLLRITAISLDVLLV